MMISRQRRGGGVSSRREGGHVTTLRTFEGLIFFDKLARCLRQFSREQPMSQQPCLLCEICWICSAFKPPCEPHGVSAGGCVKLRTCGVSKHSNCCDRSLVAQIRVGVEGTLDHPGGRKCNYHLQHRQNPHKSLSGFVTREEG